MPGLLDYFSSVKCQEGNRESIAEKDLWLSEFGLWERLSAGQGSAVVQLPRARGAEERSYGGWAKSK